MRTAGRSTANGGGASGREPLRSPRMLSLLDTLKPHLYKAPRWLAAAALVGAAVAGSAVRAENVNGVQLPDGAEKVGENRYRAKEDFDGVLKYYKAVYPAAAYPRKAIVNQPGVKAEHIENPTHKGFDGLNIYQANDEVRIYVVPSSEVKAPARKAAPKKSR